MNTRFEKEMFTWDGMYLMYKGDFAPSMETVHPDCHPSWIGKNKPQFVENHSSIVNLGRLG